MDSQEPKAAPTADYGDPQKVLEGQRKINGQLCRVDQMLVEIIKHLRLEIAKFPVFAKVDFKKIDEMLVEAYRTSGAVAHIKPPGCEPQYTADPKWTVS